MIIELVASVIIGGLIAKTKKMAFIIGAIVGFIIGFIVGPLYMSLQGMEASIVFTIVVAIIEAIVIGFVSLGIAASKLRRKAKELEKKAVQDAFE